MNKIKTIVLIGMAFLANACNSVKPWQKMYLNDESMKLSDDKLKELESSFQSYSEGATGAEGGSEGGGCGCN